MDITFRGQIFGNKTSFYILLLSSFCLKFVQTFITWYLTISIKETLISFSKAVNIFAWNSVTDITKKINPQFYLLTLLVLFLWINMGDINSLIIIRIWLLHSFIKSSCFPYSVVKLWTVGKKLLLRTLHNFCYGHYTVKHSFQRQGLVNFFVYLSTPGNYIRL